MKRFLAILACKLARWAGKLLGKGSSMPGTVALRICPDVLSRLELPSCILAVTGSNGKTSTAEMVAAILRAQGKTVVTNGEGANQTEGVATALLSHATLGGKVTADVLVLESDERYAARTFRFFQPTHLVVTNLYRDQLTRNAHPQWVYQALEGAIFPETTLILNGDDPLVSAFGRNRENVVWYGLDRASFSVDAPTGTYRDGAHCPLCYAPMEYDYAHFNHLGHYRCTKCGHEKPKTQFTATQVDLAEHTLTLDGTHTIDLAFAGVYHAYNILAAWAATQVCGVAPETALKVIDHYVLQSGRVVEFQVGARHGVLLTSKHENSVAYDTNLRYIRSQNQPCEVILLVDDISRKYYTTETSWLWDIEFEMLNAPHVEHIYLTGRYAYDLALRLSHAFLDWEKVTVQPDLPALMAHLAHEGEQPLFALTCFSDRDKLLNYARKEG